MNRKFVTFLFTFLIILSISGTLVTAFAESPAAPTNSGEELWKDVYKEVLRTVYLKELIRGIEVRYTVWDINGDDQPELIVTTRTCDADHTAAFYTVQNEMAVKIGDTSVFTGLIYGDISGTGLYLFKGYMGAYGIDHITYDRAIGMHTEKLLQGILNEDEYEYPEITNYIPGARRLAMVGISNWHLMEEYESVPDYMRGLFPEPGSLRILYDDQNFFMNIITNNQPVTWSRIGYGKKHGPVPFQTLLEEGFLSNSKLEIRQFEVADLNGDGTAEAILDLSASDSIHSAIRLYLSEQDGNTHAYVGDALDEYSYTFGDMTIDKNGNILLTSKFASFPEEHYLIRLIFESDESFIQMLPVQYYASRS